MKRHGLIYFFLFVALFVPFSSVCASTILPLHKYAWSNNSGYVNFLNVTVSDAALSGYAWAANGGWINFSPTQGGVFNDGTGKLSGYAWGEQLGWIDFNAVQITANGVFTGTATGTLIGTLTFDCSQFCDVQTDWRRATAAVSSNTPLTTTNATPVTPSPTSVPAPEPLSHTIDEIIQDPAKVEQAKQQDPVQDGTVNILDFNTMMVNWGSTSSNNNADMNGDGSVDILDFNQLMVLWGTNYQL